MARSIKLLGSLVIQQDGSHSSLMKNAKGCALLAYLVVTAEPQSRETTADLLWDSTSTSRSLSNLRMLLTRIRPHLPELHITRTTIALQADSDLDIDLLSFKDALESEDVPTLDNGLQLYKGDLLPNFYLEDAPRFNEWLMFTRERLRRQVVTAYEKVCDSYVEQQQWSNGIDAAQRWLAIDDLDEQAYRWLMICLAGNGQISQAIHQFDTCRHRLWEELGVQPEPATTALAEQLSQTVDSGQVDWGILFQPAWPEPDELAEPGPLPVNAVIPYHRNNNFTGRQNALLHLAERLLPWPDTAIQNRAIAITGIGGLGKTQLAVEFCYRYGRYFPGGVYWLNFDEPENIAIEISHIGGERGMGLFQDSEQLTLADKVGRVQKAWQEMLPRLLIFDNCEEENLLSSWLPVTGGCRILVTSRRGRWSAEIAIEPITLNVLTTPESVSLLQQLTPHLNEAEAEEIAGEVGYLPLALHLAGGFLHRYRQIQPADYLAQLRDKSLLRHPSLQGRGLSLSPTDHDLDVGRTFALSIEQLSQDDEVDEMAYRLLAHAACFAPGEPIPQDLLRETVNAGTDDLMAVLLTEDGLARLVSLGFMEVEGSVSMVMHRLVAAFILEKLGASPLLEEAQTAVEKTLIRLLAPFTDDSPKIRRPPSQTPHLRHVLEQAMTRQSPSAGLLALILGQQLWVNGEYAAAQSLLEKGLPAAEAAEDPYTMGRIMYILSRVHYSQGFHQLAQNSTLEAERLLRLAGDPGKRWLSWVYDRRGWAALRLGQPDEARAAAEASYHLTVAVNDKLSQSEALNLLASVYYFLLGEYEKADDLFQQSIALRKEIGDYGGLAVVMLNQAESAMTQGDFQRSKKIILETMPTLDAIGSRVQLLSLKTSLSEAEVRLGNFESAVEMLTDVIDQAPTDWTYLLVACNVLAEAYLGLGDTDKALEMVQTVFSMAQAADDPYNTGHAWRILGLIAARLDKALPSKAAEKTTYDAPGCFANSLTLFKDIKNGREQAMVLWEWAKYELAKGDKMKGKAMWQEAFGMFEKLNLSRFMASMKESFNSFVATTI